MEEVKLYGKTEMPGDEKGELKYYIISEQIGFEGCRLMSYGIRVKKTLFYGGGGKSVETNQINNVFYRKEDAEEFIWYIMQCRVTPIALREVVEDYIVDSISSAKKALNA